MTTWGLCYRNICIYVVLRAFSEMTDSLSLLGRAVLGIGIGEKKNWISRSLNKKWGDFSISRKWQPLASKSSITFILQSMFNNALLSKAGSEGSTGNRGGRQGIFSPQHFESIILSFRLYIASVRACDRLSVPESGSAHQTEKEIYKRRLRVFTGGGAWSVSRLINDSQSQSETGSYGKATEPQGAHMRAALWDRGSHA